MSFPLTWSLPPQVPTLAADEIHLWWIDAERCAWDLPEWLSADERARALRQCDGPRFAYFRCALRALLAFYLDAEPEDLCFAYGPHGKPQLRSPFPSLAFNLAHSHGHGLLAIRSEGELGIDLERVRPFERTLQIARRQLGPQAERELSLLPEPRRTELFFEHWARMEARTKALGGSVFDAPGAALDCLNFVPRPGWRAALASVGPLPALAAWRTFAFPPHPGEWRAEASQCQRRRNDARGLSRASRNGVADE